MGLGLVFFLQKMQDSHQWAMAGSASCYPVGHLHNSQFRCRWWRSSCTVGNWWQRRRSLQAWCDTAKSSCKAPFIFTALLKYLMRVHTHYRAVSSLIAPCYFFPFYVPDLKVLVHQMSHSLLPTFLTIALLLHNLPYLVPGHLQEPFSATVYLLVKNFTSAFCTDSLVPLFSFLIVDNVCVPFKWTAEGQNFSEGWSQSKACWYQ